MYLSQFGGGLGGNIDLRSALRSSKITIQDMGGLVLIGTESAFDAYSNTIGGSSAFLNSALFNDDVTMAGKLTVNSPSTSTASLTIRDGISGSLTLESPAKGPYITNFHNGNNGDIHLKPASSLGYISINSDGQKHA